MNLLKIYFIKIFLLFFQGLFLLSYIFLRNPELGIYFFLCEKYKTSNESQKIEAKRVPHQKQNPKQSKAKQTSEKKTKQKDIMVLGKQVQNCRNKSEAMPLKKNTGSKRLNLYLCPCIWAAAPLPIPTAGLGQLIVCA